MPFFRPYMTLSSFNRQAAPQALRHQPTARFISSTPIRFSQGYGDGEGDPKGETPQDQGSSNETKHNAEHPGPAPPSEGQGTGAGPTKGGSGGSPEEASAQSGGSRSKDAKETGSSPTGGAVGDSGGKSPDKKAASPRIHDKNVPGHDNTSDKQAEVEKHNKEFEQGHDRAPPAAEDKVDKKFWKGHGGADRES
ncbi:uncharacterized protein LY89DRAFT_730350 [Mollisia scopiformis]|uniref:Uncharacterized protein n=1 Tax=Mollisia scopiformis TaxID=149040 RepID=A0A194XKI0_MOLSC|nr:uncharacterized protein LY89DRAFT_730350 [Mollisia scopiformis]KUJ20297.1 hypothetical protein LY89DRAFT_730350 [Mollisia scopiformis]